MQFLHQSRSFGIGIKHIDYIIEGVSAARHKAHRKFEVIGDRNKQRFMIFIEIKLIFNIADIVTQREPAFSSSICNRHRDILMVIRAIAPHGIECLRRAVTAILECCHEFFGNAFVVGFLIFAVEGEALQALVGTVNRCREVTGGRGIGHFDYQILNPVRTVEHGSIASIHVEDKLVGIIRSIRHNGGIALQRKCATICNRSKGSFFFVCIHERERLRHRSKRMLHVHRKVSLEFKVAFGRNRQASSSHGVTQGVLAYELCDQQVTRIGTSRGNLVSCTFVVGLPHSIECRGNRFLGCIGVHEALVELGEETFRSVIFESCKCPAQEICIGTVDVLRKFITVCDTRRGPGLCIFLTVEHASFAGIGIQIERDSLQSRSCLKSSILRKAIGLRIDQGVVVSVNQRDRNCSCFCIKIISASRGERDRKFKVIGNRDLNSSSFFASGQLNFHIRIRQGELTFFRCIQSADHYIAGDGTAMHARLQPYGIQSRRLFFESLVICNERRIDSRIEFDIRHRDSVAVFQRFHRSEGKASQAVLRLVCRSREPGIKFFFAHIVRLRSEPVLSVEDLIIFAHIDIESEFIGVHLGRHVNHYGSRFAKNFCMDNQFVTGCIRTKRIFREVALQGNRGFAIEAMGRIDCKVHGQRKVFDHGDIEHTIFKDMHNGRIANRLAERQYTSILLQSFLCQLKTISRNHPRNSPDGMERIRIISSVRFGISAIGRGKVFAKVQHRSFFVVKLPACKLISCAVEICRQCCTKGNTIRAPVPAEARTVEHIVETSIKGEVHLNQISFDIELYVRLFSGNGKGFSIFNFKELFGIFGISFDTCNDITCFISISPRELDSKGQSFKFRNNQAIFRDLHPNSIFCIRILRHLECSLTFCHTREDLECFRCTIAIPLSRQRIVSTIHGFAFVILNRFNGSHDILQGINNLIKVAINFRFLYSRNNPAFKAGVRTA